jgi:hypothetical protein
MSLSATMDFRAFRRESRPARTTWTDVEDMDPSDGIFDSDSTMFQPVSMEAKAHGIFANGTFGQARPRSSSLDPDLGTSRPSQGSVVRSKSIAKADHLSSLVLRASDTLFETVFQLLLSKQLDAPRDAKAGEWAAAMREMQEALEAWDDAEDGRRADQATVKLVEHIIPVIAGKAVRLPYIDLQDDGSIAMRWRKRHPARAAVFSVTATRVTAILSQPGSDLGFARSIQFDEPSWRRIDLGRVENFIGDTMELPNFRDVIA